VSSLYDRDFYQWTRITSAALRTGQIAEVDLEQVAEEIEDIGKRDLRELNSRLRQTLEHMLKLRLIRAEVRNLNERGWRASITRQQPEIRTLLMQSPSLGSRIPELLLPAYCDAARVVEADFGVSAPAECPFSIEEIIG